jgi:hypothetical protein
MNIKRPTTLLCTLLALGLTSAAQERGAWRAMSNTARSITGDISLSADKLAINYVPFTIAQIRALQPTEVSAVFNDGTTGPGNLYRLNVPASKVFLHHNTLCGSDDTQWMISYVQGKTLQLAFFSGAEMPVFTHEAIANTTNLCGTYTYTR